MSNSSLVKVKVPAYSGNYTKGRSGRKIQMITIHHMAGILSAEQCGGIFQQKGRNGSSHYGIGNDGTIGLYVDECNTAWTNSNWDANCKAVTIETSNSSVGGNWPVSDKALNSLIKLVADIGKRNNLGTLVKGKNVTWHSMYANTSCPGSYLLSKMDYIVAEANKLNQQKPIPNYTGTITYQAYTNKWLGEVKKCDNTANGYAGIYGKPITAFRCKPQYGEIIYEAHELKGKWLGAVNSKNYSNGSYNSYAGILGKKIDGIRIKSTRGYVDYRVHTIEDGWLEWARGFGDKGNQFAGIYGHTIDGIQMK